MWVALLCCGVARADGDFSSSLQPSSLAAEGLDTADLIKLTTWIRDTPYPVFSILISRHGKLVYELYTSSYGRQEAHYLMSVTKSVLSALMGIAFDRHLLAGPDASIADALPRSLFASDAERARFAPITFKKIMAMSAIDAPDPPRDNSAASLARYQKFWRAPNRLVVTLQQPLLKESFQYNDCTPTLAVAALRNAAGKGVLEFAEEALFGPLGFQNYEWMHRDPSGLDNGGYGLRLRPIDMQKLGVLYLDHGRWNGRQLISQSWIDRSFAPWNYSKPTLDRPDYGWFWWTYYFGDGWTAHVANGWRGQRIAVLPQQGLVVTVTGDIEDGSESDFFAQLITKILKPAVEHGASHDAGGQKQLDALLAQVQSGPPRLADFVEYRMVPSVSRKMPR